MDDDDNKKIINKMSITNDALFIEELKKYLNEIDVNTIVTSFSKPMEGFNINRRTGRTLIGAPRYRKILAEGSLVNYKSVILKFAKYKEKEIGREAPINVDVVKKYNAEVLNDGNRKHQTIVTNIRILNRNVFGPVLNQEVQMPRKMAGALSHAYSYYNNKPQLTHEEVARTLKYLWDKCHHNRDHVYKMILIYYSGLRHAEAQALTIGDILEGWSRETGRIFIIVKRGKNNLSRNVLLFKGAPTIFFINYFLPYLDMKILELLQHRNKTFDEILRTPIFYKSQYQSTQKEFKKALKYIVRNYSSNNESSRNIVEMLKGAGIHSIRADYSTRTLCNLFKSTDSNMCIALKMVGFLLGHKNEKLTFRHYINLGYNYKTDCNKFEQLRTRMNTLANFNNNNSDSDNTNTTNNDNNNSLTRNLENLISNSSSCGNIANRIFTNNKKNHANLNNFLFICDNLNIFSIENEYNDTTTTTNSNNDSDNNINDDDDNDDYDDNYNNNDNDNDDDDNEEVINQISII